MKKQAIIVTGGAGFVGSNLVHKIVNNGYETHVLTRENSNLWRLADIEKKIVIHTNLLLQPQKLTKILAKVKPYGIVHLATNGAYPSQQDSNQMITTNILGTVNLLDSAKKLPIKRIIIAGSSSEYGKKIRAMKEVDILEPNNFYGATKAAQIHIAGVYAKAYKLPITILRLFSVYGPFEEKGRLVRTVIESALQNIPIKLATGKEARDLIFIDDVVDACLYALEHDSTKGEIFNIGTGKQTTIHQLAKIVKQLTRSSSPIIKNAYPGREWDTTHWVANMKKTNAVLNWQAQYSLKQGLIKTIEWYSNYEKN